MTASPSRHPSPKTLSTLSLNLISSFFFIHPNIILATITPPCLTHHPYFVKIAIAPALSSLSVKAFKIIENINKCDVDIYRECFSSMLITLILAWCSTLSSSLLSPRETDKVYKELDEGKAEVDKLKADLRAKTNSLENLKKSHNGKVNQIQEVNIIVEKLEQDLLQKEDELIEESSCVKISRRCKFIKCYLLEALSRGT